MSDFSKQLNDKLVFEAKDMMDLGDLGDATKVEKLSKIAKKTADEIKDYDVDPALDQWTLPEGRTTADIKKTYLPIYWVEGDDAFVSKWNMNPTDRVKKKTELIKQGEQESTDNWTVEEVVMACMPFIKKWARRYAGHNFEIDDAISEGMAAVIDSIRLDKGTTPFGLYAATHIRDHIKDKAMDSGLVRVPPKEYAASKVRAEKLANDKIAELEKVNERPLSDDEKREIRKHYNRQELRGGMSSKGYGVQSLSTPTGEEGEGTISDIIPGSAAERQFGATEKGLERGDLAASSIPLSAERIEELQYSRELIDKAFNLANLNPTEREIIKMSYGITDDDLFDVERSEEDIEKDVEGEVTGKRTLDVPITYRTLKQRHTMSNDEIARELKKKNKKLTVHRLGKYKGKQTLMPKEMTPSEDFVAEVKKIALGKLVKAAEKLKRQDELPPRSRTSPEAEKTAELYKRIAHEKTPLEKWKKLEDEPEIKKPEAPTMPKKHKDDVESMLSLNPELRSMTPEMRKKYLELRSKMQDISLASDEPESEPEEPEEPKKSGIPAGLPPELAAALKMAKKDVKSEAHDQIYRVISEIIGLNDESDLMRDVMDIAGLTLEEGRIIKSEETNDERNGMIINKLIEAVEVIGSVGGKYVQMRRIMIEMVQRLSK